MRREQRKRERLESGEYTHGTSGYLVGCRCETCRGAHRAAAREQKARRLADPAAEHGLAKMYTYGCRCGRCRVAYQKQQKSSRARRLATDDLRHGSADAYQAGCRCSACTSHHVTTQSFYQQRRTERTTKRLAEGDFQHGVRGYDIGCRCDICTQRQSARAKQKTEQARREREAGRQALAGRPPDTNLQVLTEWLDERHRALALEELRAPRDRVVFLRVRKAELDTVRDEVARRLGEETA